MVILILYLLGIAVACAWLVAALQRRITVADRLATLLRRVGL